MNLNKKEHSLLNYIKEHMSFNNGDEERIKDFVIMTSGGLSCCLEAFDPKVMNLTRWEKRLVITLKLIKCEEHTEINSLLHFMGAKVYNVLKEHFEPNPNEVLECYRFHSRNQVEGESCVEFVVALKRMASTCNFGDYLNTALNNQFVFGLNNHAVQRRLLENIKLTLESAVNISEAVEIAKKSGLELNINVVNVMQAYRKKNEVNIRKI